jgi:hypothetical protein
MFNSLFFITVAEMGFSGWSSFGTEVSKNF